MAKEKYFLGRTKTTGYQNKQIMMLPSCSSRKMELIHCQTVSQIGRKIQHGSHDRQPENSSEDDRY